MTGMLKAKVGGQWQPVVPVGPAGPQGPQGPPGPSGSVKTKGRAFTADLKYGAPTALPVPGPVGASFNAITLNDGFSVSSNTYLICAAAGRFHCQAHVTVYGGTPGDWITFEVVQRDAGANIVRRFQTVASNRSAGYRMASVMFTTDLVAGGWLNVQINMDAAGAMLDNRSWFTVAEVAW